MNQLEVTRKRVFDVEKRPEISRPFWNVVLKQMRADLMAAKDLAELKNSGITHEQIHKPGCCNGCGEELSPNLPFQAIRGYCSIEIEPPEPGKIGLVGTYTKHIFGTVRCPYEAGETWGRNGFVA